MTKKSKILYWTLLIVNLVCFILDLLPIPLSFSFFNFSFGTSLMLIGLLLVTRAVTLKLDSSMFLGWVFFFCGGLNLFTHIYRLAAGVDLTVQTIPYYLFGLSVASLITAIYFKDKTQAKLCILFLGFGLITLTFVRHLIPLWLFIVLMCVWFVGYFVINIILHKKGGKRNG
ncbi:MAG: hypothetical protein MJ152_02965 [Clostridia bacterium]|nr:hypothetical protein [Clostridia bacterium]